MAQRIVFPWHAAFSVATLEALVRAGHEIVAVYSQPPPRPAGAGWISPPRRCIRRPRRTACRCAPPEFQGGRRPRGFRALNADVAVVVAYGLLLCPRRSCRHPARRLIMAMPRSCRAGGVRRRSSAPSWPATARPAMMVMQMEKGLDTGPVALHRPRADRRCHHLWPAAYLFDDHRC